MDQLSYKTISANKQTVQKEWVLVDAENQTVGRLATRVANILRGKTHKLLHLRARCLERIFLACNFQSDALVHYCFSRSLMHLSISRMSFEMLSLATVLSPEAAKAL